MIITKWRRTLPQISSQFNAGAIQPISQCAVQCALHAIGFCGSEQFRVPLFQWRYWLLYLIWTENIAIEPWKILVAYHLYAFVYVSWLVVICFQPLYHVQVTQKLVIGTLRWLKCTSVTMHETHYRPQQILCYLNSLYLKKQVIFFYFLFFNLIVNTHHIEIFIQLLSIDSTLWSFMHI